MPGVQEIMDKPKRFDRQGNPILKAKDVAKLLQKTNSENPQMVESPNKSPNGKKEKEDKKTKFKVTFLDKIDKDADLARIHYVLSYKKYNAMNTFDPLDPEEREPSSHCCTTF